MSDQHLDLIERQVTDFIRRIILTEKQFNNLDRSAYILLRQLATYGPAGVKTLAQDLHLDISTVSRQASVLVDKKYVEKIPNPDDRRSYYYQITSIGSLELEENKQRRYDRLSGILEDWSEEDKERFGLLLKKYNETVNEKLDL
ncbi:DNA-binding transcriptional regulator, MarR family [Halobacillus alkaliphilus]|uniref:DNA-binding transcriptional regulator, MarR family n=1 Tax=Halobacillus alkaliphilus TaxID=396056 RepID=A0A1I2TKM6_9BACI|nr:MarR family transcriptional regulator [Halobacillus alkaliphilus]SFG63026.1 DNA-binding transcriptional regulator, MarR family [Halobacillus alkaliphilus]